MASDDQHLKDEGADENSRRLMDLEEHGTPCFDPKNAPNGFKPDGNEAIAAEKEATEADTAIDGIDCNNIQIIATPIKPTRTLTKMQSLMNFVKGNIGIGILAVPSAYKYGGLWVSFAGMFFLGFISVHCMHILVQCAHRICEKTGQSSMDYGDVVQESFRIGPQRLKRFSKFSRILVNIFICLTQFGFCTVYILFIADNIEKVIEQYTDIDWRIQVYELFVTILLAPYLCIRNLRIISYFSAVANVFMIFGLGVVLYSCFIDLPPVQSRPAFASWSTLPLYFGIAVYAFEAIGVVLPIENKMKRPSELGGWTGVLNIGVTIAILLFSFIGFFGYLRFGDEIQGSITLNLPEDFWLYSMIRVTFAVATFITYAVQFYVPVQILWPMVRARSTGWMRIHGEYLIRLSILIVTFILAAVIPHLDLMISLIGALASNAIALIIPPILEMVIVWPDREFGRYHWKAVKNVAIMCVGLLGFVVGVTVTLIAIVDKFRR